MPKLNPENERIKRHYFTYLKEAKRRGEPSVDAAAKALSRFERQLRFRSFKDFHREQAVAFKRHLAEQSNLRTGKPLSKATIHSTLAALKAFFVWLADQPGFRSRLSYSDADYLNDSDRDSRIAQTRPDKLYLSLEQFQHVNRTMPAGDAFQLRDRALVALILLTGARDGAGVTLKLKHLDLTENLLFQDAREVATKFGKSFTTWFFPVGDEARRIVEEWATYLVGTLHWGPSNPLFPAPRMEAGPDRLARAVGLDRRHWTTAAPIREVFERAFAAAGLPYYSPHRLRDTLAALGKRLCQTPEHLEAWALNLGHSSMMTTFASYAKVEPARHAEIIRGIALGPAPPDKALEAVATLVAQFQGRPAPT